ncbi:MAG: glycosyltransferase family 9 protein [Negativicutes bacterium]|jgi:ADP-heptose:LPS heptosyltransferase
MDILSSRYNKCSVFVHQGLGDLIMAIPLLVGIFERVKSESFQLVFYVKTKNEVEFIKTIIGTNKNVRVDIIGQSQGTNKLLRVLHTLRILLCTSWKKQVIISPYFTNSYWTAAFLFFFPYSFKIGTLQSKLKRCLNFTVQYKIGNHKAEHVLQLCEAVGVLNALTIADIRENKFNSSFLKKKCNISLNNCKKDNTIIFSPGSGEAEKYKRWPVNKFSELANLLLSDDLLLKIIIIGNESELELANEIIAGVVYKDRIVSKNNLRFIEILAEIERSNAIVCACSGMAHVASLTSTKIIGLFGPTDYRVTGPYSTNVTIVSSDMSCSPCYPKKNLCMTSGESECMRRIVATDVFNVLVSKITYEG